MARKPPAPEAAETDEALWRAYVRTVAPLPGRRPKLKARAMPEPDVVPNMNPTKDSAENGRPELPAAQPPKPAARRTSAAKELAAGEISGVDRRLGDRLRRGRLAIDATLDLHGLVYESAAREVTAFVMRAHERGLRTLLIVTGKGSRAGGEGLLRQSLPRWLNGPELRSRVLAFSAAQPRHGGGGAFYVLLKKRRPGAPVA